MKKHYTVLSALLLTASASFGQASELFFSEYTEGAHQNGVKYPESNPKASTGSERALEIFNPTKSTVNLDAYSVRRYSNGSTTVTEEEKLHRATGENTLLPAEVFVFASGESSLSQILTVADQLSAGHAPVTGPDVLVGGGVAYFNGDDAVALVRYASGKAGVGPGVIVDLIGVIGEQPLKKDGTTGGNWSSTNAADNTTDGKSVFVSSANQSLIRRPDVSGGIRINPLPQNVPGSVPPVANTGGYAISDTWMMYSTAFNGPDGSNNPAGQDYSRLGSHEYDFDLGTYDVTLKTLDKFNTGISIYPNPAQGGKVNISLRNVKVGTITVLNNMGQRISVQPRNQTDVNLTLDVSKLKAGLYFVQCTSTDGQLTVYKELVIK
ncbi:T9SS type A sorting domain-containing protein [Hymenobacter guriensis]|uniref:T9SS type A sorting domain-containing protein n=1 Tax=Hymenobacter guriensis TaxID=2793065 RepID=A0ABS0KVQ6_9BACT|nr:T9SS type A sorting domain-containing protein [Hymenobacter guriensis]MBG8551937.1 T9SS type A sorting domain-containing protein [Hymenobacter guriensis]